jgi:hypothetical protein
MSYNTASIYVVKKNVAALTAVTAVNNALQTL